MDEQSIPQPRDDDDNKPLTRRIVGFPRPRTSPENTSE